jgi:hypothetical protein
MDSPGWAESAAPLIAGNPTLAAFWEDLRPIYDAFERNKRVPEVEIDAEGRYRLKAEATSTP